MTIPQTSSLPLSINSRRKKHTLVARKGAHIHVEHKTREVWGKIQASSCCGRLAGWRTCSALCLCRDASQSVHVNPARVPGTRVETVETGPLANRRKGNLTNFLPLSMEKPLTSKKSSPGRPRQPRQPRRRLLQLRGDGGAFQPAPWGVARRTARLLPQNRN